MYKKKGAKHKEQRTIGKHIKNKELWVKCIKNNENVKTKLQKYKS